jgi:hypothetical protein
VRIAAANAGIFSWLVPLSVAGLSGCALLGCATDHQHVKRIPLPSQALLTPQPDPGCALKSVATTAPGAAPQPSTHLLGQVIKLEYERNCFERAEWRVRSRLLRLQAAVAKTISAVKRVGHDASSGP